MKGSDLDLRELLELPPSGGVLRMAGQRVLLMDAVALGLLRGELLTTLGPTLARGVLTRFGYAHGWRTAQVMKDLFQWDTEREWRLAGAILHRLQGLVVSERPVTTEGEEPFAETIWRQSYEAEQHLLSVGPSNEPVCWTLCGFASGYMSFVNGKPVYCVEDRCVACGDPTCHMIGRFAEDWGDALPSIEVHYRGPCVESALGTVAATLKRTEEQLDRVKKELIVALDPEVTPSGMIVASAEMRRVVELSRRVARADSTVLVTGESGVGKERIAKLIHDASDRAKKPLIAVNCGAMTDTLLESELFGHARGAFTGASTDRAGLFEAAHGGTLFLDEIGEVSPALQVKLLRVLQEREVRRVGENKARSVDVRIVAATHRDLAREVSRGSFRQDLFYRLRVIEVHIPSLRARRDDVLPLAHAMLTRCSTRLGRVVTGFTPRAADAMLRYPWPGNVRELENAVERAVVLCEGNRVDLEDLPEEVRARRDLAKSALVETFGAVGHVGQSLDQVERALILATLAANHGHQARTAQQLGIGSATLYRKLRKYDVEAEAPTAEESAK